MSAVSSETFMWVSRDGFIYLDTLENVVMESVLVGFISFILEILI